jgi:putative transposase
VPGWADPPQLTPRVYLKSAPQWSSTWGPLQAEVRLADFAEEWDEKHPIISRAWRQQWDRLTPFFAYPPEIRKVIYTTNAIESLNDSIRSLVKNRRAFPNDEAATKLLYLALQKIAKKWSKPIKDWKAALNQLAIRFEDRLSII